MGDTVSHIIALDAVHHMFLSVSNKISILQKIPVLQDIAYSLLAQDYLKVYPNAKLVGPKGLVSKRSELKFDIVQPENPLDAELAQEFKAVALTGHPNEVGFVVYFFRRIRHAVSTACIIHLRDANSRTLHEKDAMTILTLPPSSTNRTSSGFTSQARP